MVTDKLSPEERKALKQTKSEASGLLFDAAEWRVSFEESWLAHREYVQMVIVVAEEYIDLLCEAEQREKKLREALASMDRLRRAALLWAEDEWNWKPGQELPALIDDMRPDMQILAALAEGESDDGD